MRKLSAEHKDRGEWLCDPDGSVFVLHSEQPDFVVRAIGKLHYEYGKQGRRILFRGQSQLYGGSLKPSLWRNLTGAELVTEAKAQLGQYLTDFWEPKFRSKHVDDGPAVEALLQHYGLKTSWLDVVDTLWPALWFASHRLSPLQKRAPGQSYEPSDSPYCYLLCLKTGVQQSPPVRGSGLVQDEDCELVDLRIAASSLFLRPHCQHGQLIRSANGDAVDYWHLVEGIIRLPTPTVLKWLGDSELVSERFLFPAEDFGLNDLKRYAKLPPENLGNGFA